MATSDGPAPGEKKSRKKEHQKLGVTTGTSETGEVFTFFYGTDTPFSQFHPAKFVVDGQEYNCAEQYMMHQKAVVFGDAEMAAKILVSKVPKEQKAFGRQVSNFNVDEWNSKCRDIVRRGNMAKFSQNEDLKKVLLDTKGTTLVEASPRDTIWGIGLGARSEKATDRKMWRGTNWLGEAIMAVRKELLKNGDSEKTHQ